MGRERFATGILPRHACMCAFAMCVSTTGYHLLAEEEPAPFLEEVTIVT